MASFRIRAGRDEDAETVAVIWSEGWADGHIGHVPDELVSARTPDSFRSRAAARVKDTIVAVVEDEVAGFIMTSADEVEQVYVSSRHRGSGVAAGLLAAAEQLVAGAGHPRAWLAVVAGNERARRFYAKCGWVDEGPMDYPAIVESGSLIVPVHRYAKPVQP